jgi:alpha-tubulin suppressor-like RCC1 family protein
MKPKALPFSRNLNRLSLGLVFSSRALGWWTALFTVFLGAASLLHANSANHTAFITQDNVLKMMGSNSNGQLGLPAVSQTSAPIQSKFGVREISAGSYHTVYLMWDGTVWATGSNASGRLGDGTSTARSNPVQVVSASGSPFSGVVSISTGLAFSVFLKSDGTVWATGGNNGGQLGDGTTTSRSNPVPVIDSTGSPITGITEIAAGYYHAAYLKTDGTVWAAGWNPTGELGDGTTTRRTKAVQVVDAGGSPITGVTGISAGREHTVFLMSDGTVWSTGSNNSGLLGDGTTIQRRNPVQVVDSGGSPITGVMEIVAGRSHSVYLKGDGTIWATGKNSDGQLGDGSTTNRSNPVQVTDAGGSPINGVVKIAAFDSHTVYLKNDQSVWAVGKNVNGELGDGSTSNRSNPVQVTDAGGLPVTNVTAIATGGNHTIFLKNHGTVLATGKNHKGQLGDGTNTDRLNPVRTLSSLGGALSEIIQVSADGSTVFLKSDGTVWATGTNGSGELGDGTTINRSNPIQVIDAGGSPLTGVIDVSAGSFHMVYLNNDGTVWATGKNDYGQLGDGSTTNRINPVQVVDAGGNPLTGVVEVSAGGSHTVFLKSDGTVWVTGGNGNGQLGDGTWEPIRSNPVQVVEAGGNPFTGVIEVSAGEAHTVYLKSDGTAWAAGRNAQGTLGDGTFTDRINPVQVVDAGGSALSGVSEVSAGYSHTVLLKSDGTVWATGSNDSVQLGDGTIAFRSNPVQVTKVGGAGLTGVVGISAGGFHTVCLKSDGTVWATGRNYEGQLGDGTTTQQNRSVQVVNGGGIPDHRGDVGFGGFLPHGLAEERRNGLCGGKE